MILPLLLFLGFFLPVTICRGIDEGSTNETNTQEQFHSGVESCYTGWKKKYLKPSVTVPGDFKIAFNRSGTTVSEAMGYGMLITVMMADVDPQARQTFDGLDRFRKRFPSEINPALMAWKIPNSEVSIKNDSATDGDMDMALALLMAHRTWGDVHYLNEAKILIQALAAALIRPDETLRLGDWDTEASATEMIRTSDLMPTHFRIFAQVTGDPRWAKVESRGYAILHELQERFAPKTGLVPDFAVLKKSEWQPAPPKALEGPYDGDYSYNACRVPWRIGWSAVALRDERAGAFLKPFMAWAKSSIGSPEDFKAGYHLDGKMLKGADFDSPCFITPTGVAAMATGDAAWRNGVMSYGLKAHEGYYEDSVNLLCLLVMTGKDRLSVKSEKKLTW
jgi:endo-1,4-beta-D-glucanase Y